MKAFAEWEKQEALLVALPHLNSDWKDDLEEILDSYKVFVESVSKYQKVIVISPSKKDFDRFFSNQKNIEFMQIDTNDTWIRDYGPIDVKDNGNVLSYNFQFNAWGNKFESEKDNLVNKWLFKNLQENLIDVDLILEGGSIDFNGDGVMLTTKTCLLNENRNSNYSFEYLDKKLKELFGLNAIIWLEHGFIKGDDTDSHVDTLARFINKNTIAYASCNDINDIHYEELKKMEKELKNTNFNLLPLEIPKPVIYKNRRLAATYLNFIFINNALIVPIYNDLNDEVVIEKLTKTCVDRKIIPIDSRVFIRQNGSLHCSSQNRFLRNNINILIR